MRRVADTIDIAAYHAPYRRQSFQVEYVEVEHVYGSEAKTRKGRKLRAYDVLIDGKRVGKSCPPGLYENTRRAAAEAMGLDARAWPQWTCYSGTRISAPGGLGRGGAFTRSSTTHAASEGGHMKLTATIEYLRRCQAARAAGYPVALTTDPAWLVNEAINRRAGWLEDPHTRGTTMPVDGTLPRKADGAWQRHLRLIAREVNTPRLVVRVERLGEHRWLADRLPHRIEATT